MFAKLKFWQRPPAVKPVLILNGFTEEQMRHAFLTSPDSELYAGTLEQCDQLLMETVNELVNQADAMTDGTLRQRVGQLRGITELRELLERRKDQAQRDAQALRQDQTPDEN